MTKQEDIELMQLLEEEKRQKNQNLALFWFNQFYDWQYDFCAATKEYYEACLMAANQVGKSLGGEVQDAFHLLGDYPDNWPGHKFNYAPFCWGLGFSMEKTRDILQTALFGKYDKDNGFAGGLIPEDRIVGRESVSGVVNAMRTVRVKHSSGGISTIQFWAYSQGPGVMMGDKIDWFHIDEEPKDQRIRPQVLTRTINGGGKGEDGHPKGGRGIYTFTPENGSTDLVLKFRDSPSKDQFFMQKGWVDAPHMTKEKMDRLLEQYPDHEKDMRSKGDAILGHGRIYDLSDELILCDPFEIEDHWKIICGLDFGDDHPQAIVKIAYNLEADTIYVVNSWKARRVSANDAWGATKAWVGRYPVAWPTDGLQGEKARDDSKELKTHYVDAGFNMLFERATWIDGGVSVESGIYDIINRGRKGKFKVFRGQPDFMEEWRQYHRNEAGKRVEIRDDMLDAVRYAIMMLRHAVYNSEGNTIGVEKGWVPKPMGVIGRKVRR